MYVFHVETHHDFPWYEQCLTFGSFNSTKEEVAYNMLAFIGTYAIPLVVIVLCYAGILMELHKQANRDNAVWMIRYQIQLYPWSREQLYPLPYMVVSKLALFGFFSSSAQLNQSQLNLSSGIPIPDDASSEILRIREIGEEQYDDFVKYRNFNRKIVIKKSSKEKSIESNRNILGTLLAISARNERAVNFKTALCYPLCPVPLSLANPDGSRKATAKSKLQSIVLKYSKEPVQHPRESVPQKSQVSTFIVDLMASIRTIKELPDTYEDFTWKFLKSMPSGYNRIDIVADTYQDNSIKSGERDKRGSSEKIMIQSATSKAPRNFGDFLKNGENKRRLISLMKDGLKRHSLMNWKTYC
ncbi:Gonadotropin-releasing hormone II receptor [Nymphon striatum]|nr:Gonadotropin-releasing hormone II receptor [Nymphon striatum]